jgi:uncharacterized membrane protein
MTHFLIWYAITHFLIWYAIGVLATTCLVAFLNWKYEHRWTYGDLAFIAIMSIGGTMTLIATLLGCLIFLLCNRSIWSKPLFKGK